MTNFVQVASPYLPVKCVAKKALTSRSWVLMHFPLLLWRPFLSSGLPWNILRRNSLPVVKYIDCIAWRFYNQRLKKTVPQWKALCWSWTTKSLSITPLFFNPLLSIWISDETLFPVIYYFKNSLIIHDLKAYQNTDETSRAWALYPEKALLVNVLHIKNTDKA